VGAEQFKASLLLMPTSLDGDWSVKPDTRNIEQGALFIALQGLILDGPQFLSIKRKKQGQLAEM